MTRTSTLIVGCGYLGRRVADRLLARGDRVVGTTRDPARAETLRAAGIEPLLLDLTFAELPAMPATDRLFFCVALGRDAVGRSDLAYHDGPARVVRAWSGGDGRRVVLAGTTGVYGQEDGRWVDEDTPPEPRAPGSLIPEERLRQAEPGAVILRYAGLYGPGRVIRRAAIEAGEPIAADPDAYLNLIQIDDAATAAIAALDHPAPGPLYLVADDAPAPRRHYYETLAGLLGAPSPRFTPPSRPEVNRRIRNGRAKRDLGLTLAYPDVESGLRSALAGAQPSAGSM